MPCEIRRIPRSRIMFGKMWRFDTNTPIRHYVMENMKSDDHTMIAVKATLQGNSSYQDHTKIFTAVINAGGLQNGYDHNFIRRNYVYRLRIYFDGESFDNIPVTPDPTPDPDPEPEVDTNLNIAVQVVGWGRWYNVR